MTCTGARHFGFKAQSVHSVAMLLTACASVSAVSAGVVLKRCTCACDETTPSRLTIPCMCLEHFLCFVPNRSRRSASVSTSAGVGFGNILSPRYIPRSEPKRRRRAIGESIRLVNHTYLSTYSSWGCSVLIRRGANPGHQCVGVKSVFRSERRQPLANVTIGMLFKPAGCQKVAKAPHKLPIRNFHLTALSSAPLGMTPS